MTEPNDENLNLLVVVHKVEDWILVTTITAVVVLSAVQIILRNLFESGVAWISPLLGVLILWVGLLGALMATRQRAHIKINVLSSFLPEKINVFLQLVVSLFSAFILFVISYFSIEFIKLDLNSSTLAFGNVPVWVTETIIPVSFALMGIRFLIQAIIDFVGVFRRRSN